MSKSTPKTPAVEEVKIPEETLKPLTEVNEPAAEETAAENQEPVKQTQAAEEPVTEAEPVVDPVVAAAIVAEDPNIARYELGFFSEETRLHVLNLLASGDTLAVVTLGEVLDYVRHMKPSAPMGELEGAQHQRKLFSSLTHYFNTGSNNFGAFMGTLLAVISETTEGHAFGMISRHRFLESSNFKSWEVEAFSKIIHLITLTADASVRKQALKQIDLQAALELRCLNEDARQRLMTFYGRFK